MKCVILQPSYIPWRGYFDQINKADLFIFYDDVQYDKRGWRNRNQIKTTNGKQWLTIPVKSHGAQTQQIPINQIPISWDLPWNDRHLQSLTTAYSKAPFFKMYKEFIEEYYFRHDDLLSDFTIAFTIALTKEIGITHTKFMRSSEIESSGMKTDRLIGILQKVGADHYISGLSAKDYIENEKFVAAGIELEYMQYDYIEYPQLYPPYDPFVSILDLLFMTGPEAGNFFPGGLN